jgi:cell division protein FtsB
MSRIMKQPPFWSRYAPWILGMVLVALAVHDVFGAHGFLAMRRTQKQIEEIRGNIDHLNRENTALGGEVQSLKTDPKAIERIAREEMGLARPGEVIIKLPPPDPSTGTNSAH